MCLYVKEKSKVKTLKRARLGWKLVQKLNDGNFWGSPIQTETNEYNKVCIAKRRIGYIHQEPIDDIVIEQSFNYHVVNEGYHSYRTLFAAVLMWQNDLEYLRPCVIPKGTRYVNGESFERVSKEIIVCRTLKDALKILHEQNRRKEEKK